LSPRPEAMKVLDPSAKKILDMLATAGMADASGLTPQQMREGFYRLALMVDYRQAPIGKIEDGELLGPGGRLRTRIYVPQVLSSDPAPGIVYFHGGGGIFGSIDTHEGICRMLANESGCKVIAVGYRQAPEHKFPAALDDAYAATEWVVEQAARLGLDPQRIAVGGDSAGGNLAAVVCQRARQENGPRIALQVLFCPFLDLNTSTVSWQIFEKGYFLNKATVDWMLGHYCAADMDRADPRISPLRASDLAGLPQAHIHTAEFDPLRDDGEAYASRLKRAGVGVRYTCHSGMIHHFFGMAGVIPYARIAMKAAGSAIKQSLSLSPQSTNHHG
jgi:acetyl esterase